MDRNSFYYLFVNSQSTLDLAMQLMAEQLMADMEAEMPDEEEQLEMTDEALEAQAAKEREYWSKFDLESLKNENGEYDLSRMQPAVSEQEGNEQDAVFELPPPAELTAEQIAARAASIEKYLADAYGYEQDQALQARIDQCYQQVDLPALKAALAQLPPELPPLTEALSVEGMASWVRICEGHNEAFSEVVSHFRQFAMAEEEALGLELE